MVTPRSGKAAACALLLVALMAAGGAVAQPLFDPRSADAQREILEQIEQVEAEHGPRSARLIGLLRGLSTLYQENGDYALAAAAIERAWDLVRVNYGVHSLDQAPLIEERIEIARARNSPAEAWNLQQALLVLARRHPDDVRTIAILREIGDERMAILERYVDGEFPPQMILGCYYDDGRPEAPLAAAQSSMLGACTAGSRGTAVRSLLWEAQMHYSDAIKVALANDLYASDELRALENALVRGSFLYGATYGDGRDYALGRESLRRLAAYEAAVSAPPLAQTEALIGIADWDILFSRSRDLQESALVIYERAYRRLRESGQPEAAIDALFAPETPVALPTFLPNPFVAQDPERATGFIEFAFDVTREGKGRNIEILETTMSSARAAERRVAELVLRSRFRPRLVDGEFVESARVTVRYYLNETAANGEEP